MKKKILILTQSFDPHVLPVAEEIKRRDMRTVRFDFGDFPEKVQLAARIGPHRWEGTLRHADQIHDLAEIQSVWWRRPNSPQASTSYDIPTRVFLDRENLRGFIGVMLQQGQDQERLFWVSKRDRIQIAEFKPIQLQEAQALGLRVPHTLITNNPAEVRAFYQEFGGQIIVKAIGKGAVDPNNTHHFGDERFVYTSQVLAQDLENVEEVRVCAHLFQEMLRKSMDLRVIVIGRRIFTIGIHAHAPQTALDWRVDYSSLSYSVEQLPTEIEQKVLQLVRHFDLQYSSMDFILTPTGEYIFIEMNPNGQFLWMEPPTGLPMASAMADLLCFPQEYCL